MTIRVAVVDDQFLVRSGLRVLLAGEPDLEFAGEAGDGEQAVRMIRQVRPDVVLLDIRMPGLDGIETLRRITADPGLTQIKVIMLTTFDLDDYIFEALRSGASGFLLKEAEPVDLLRAIRVVAAGESLLSPAVTRTVIERLTRLSPRPRRLHPGFDLLTEREREVVGLVAAGLSNAEIARRLVVSEATVRTHISRSLFKTGARDRAQLVVFAYQSGMPVPGT